MTKEQEIALQVLVEKAFHLGLVSADAPIGFGHRATALGGLLDAADEFLAASTGEGGLEARNLLPVAVGKRVLDWIEHGAPFTPPAE